MSARQAIGIDIGGTGIKGGVVDLDSGELVGDRLVVPTPEGGRPQDVARVTQEVLENVDSAGRAVGVCVPAVVRQGRTLSAANISAEWIGLDAEGLFQHTLGRPVRLINDADAAGLAEVRFGRGTAPPGVTLVITLGTGIGSALFIDGALVPNTELGHLKIDGEIAERRAAFSSLRREQLEWREWAGRISRYIRDIERLFSPDLIVIGGGGSAHFDHFAHHLEVSTLIRCARFHNNAGIVGAATLARS
ncbi:polyphosphate--glucose phosphotransferase [Brachybacterium kimchii]|uniref:ROK family protein n=1 Tax=Brachybacterium kimchii TaxID=2942909 RepID=A0ABY4N7C2_9MICO|nr:ROK family protein [Brachybacterium kimchii]UQN30447.1 ROK family protein [Brachybacterium kimchii]